MDLVPRNDLEVALKAFIELLERDLNYKIIYEFRKTLTEKAEWVNLFTFNRSLFLQIITIPNDHYNEGDIYKSGKVIGNILTWDITKVKDFYRLVYKRIEHD